MPGENYEAKCTKGTPQQPHVLDIQQKLSYKNVPKTGQNFQCKIEDSIVETVNSVDDKDKAVTSEILI